MPYRLEYGGKRSTDEILAEHPSELITIGAVEGSPTNRLIYGDNLPVLASLLRDERVAGHVRLVYIDPPFATQSRFESRQQAHAYDDHLTGAEYLEFLRARLILLRELIADDGSLYLHLDSKMAFEGKILLDEVFGPKNFRNLITRKKSNPKNYTRKQFGNVTDFILFYSKSSHYVWNQVFEPRDEVSAAREYRFKDQATGRRYMKVPVHAPGVRNGVTGGEWNGMLPPRGKHWQLTPERLTELDRRGDIYWSPSGNPRRKLYMDDAGAPAQDLWLDFKDAHNQMIEVTGYPTEKNLKLLERIVAASSDVGDIVLDAFSGSGTTAIAAESLGRQWIAIDNSPLAIETTVGRLTSGSERMGDFVSERSGHGPNRLPTSAPLLRGGLEVQADAKLQDVQPVPVR